MKPNFDFRLMLKIMTAAVILTGLSACQTTWDASPDFGETVNDAVQAQLVNPKAPVGNKKVTKGLDGSAAKSAVDNYQKSFEVRAPIGSSAYPTGSAVGTSSGGR